MVSHQSDATIGAGNSSCLVFFPAKFIKGLPQCVMGEKVLAHSIECVVYATDVRNSPFKRKRKKKDIKSGR